MEQTTDYKAILQVQSERKGKNKQTNTLITTSNMKITINLTTTIIAITFLDSTE